MDLSGWHNPWSPVVKPAFDNRQDLSGQYVPMPSTYRLYRQNRAAIRNCIVNFPVGGTCFFCPLNMFFFHGFAQFLHLGSNGQQGFHFFADRCIFRIVIYLIQEVSIAAKSNYRSAMRIGAEPAPVAVGNYRGDQFLHRR